MTELFAWYNLIFEIPVLFGVLLAIGSALGLDHHLDAEIGDADFHSPLEALGFGRCPVLIVLATMGLTFGGTGLVVGRVAGKVFPLLALPTVLGAMVVMVVVTRFVAGLVARHLPTTETSSRTLADLVGKTGRMTLPTGEDRRGQAMFLVGGDVFSLAVVSDDGMIQKGESVIVTEYDEAAGVLLVVRDPLGTKGRL